MEQGDEQVGESTSRSVEYLALVWLDPVLEPKVVSQVVDRDAYSWPKCCFRTANC